MCMAELALETSLDLRGVLVNVGWDTAGFSLGSCFLVFSDPFTQKYYGPADTVSCLAVSFAVTLLGIMGILVLRKERHTPLVSTRPVGPTGITGVSSVFLGSMGLSFPLYFHAHARGFSMMVVLKALRIIT